MKYYIAVLAVLLASCTHMRPLEKVFGVNPDLPTPKKTDQLPDRLGQYEVGTLNLDIDGLQMRIWYPAQKHGHCRKVRYLMFIKGNACRDLGFDSSGAPYPMILFSHGSNGKSFQSYSLTSRLASHGFVVVAPTHKGNTLFDSPTQKEMAEIALRRPKDIALVLQKIKELSLDESQPFYQKIDFDNVGVAGHSFGAYTALVVAGGVIDVGSSIARCENGSKNNVFSGLLGYWDVAYVRREKGLEGIRCALALAPGGYQAFGLEGIAQIKTPVMIMTGLQDEKINPYFETRPIYSALKCAAYKIEFARAGHLNFTDLCRLPLSGFIPGLKDMCNKKRLLDLDRGFEIINVFATAFFRKYLKAEAKMDYYLSPAYAASYKELVFEKK